MISAIVVFIVLADMAEVGDVGEGVDGEDSVDGSAMVTILVMMMITAVGRGTLVKIRQIMQMMHLPIRCPLLLANS